MYWNWNGLISTLNFIVVSFGPFFAPTHTMEPISIVNHIGESPAVPSLNKLIWTSSHCQDSLIGEMKSFNEPTVTSAVNTAAVNDQRIHKKQNLNKSRLKKHSHTTNNVVPTSTDILSISDKFKNNNENRESLDQKRSKKRVINNSPKDSHSMESLDEEGDIGAVFESSDSSYGLISEYDTSDLSKLRERFNYASIDCGANVLKANKEAKGTSSVLSESKDSYVLNKCSAEKHIIVELCYPILIDTIVLANFEFFSSTFKNVRVSISKWYPPKEDWKVIGEYLARNSRELQIFNVKDPIMFAKYIRIDFQTHYGHHYYCPVSLLRVHGNSETDMWNKEQEQGELDSSTSQESQINDGPDDDTLLEPSTESTEKDLNLLKEIQNSEHLKVEDKLQPKQSYIEQCNINNSDKTCLVKTKNIFEYKICSRDDPLDFKIFQGSSLTIHSGICHVDKCPVIITELDLLSDNYDDLIVPYDELPKKDNDMKEKPSQVQPKQNNNNGKINLSVGGPNQSTYMLLFKRIHTLEVNTKREQNKLLKDVFGKVDTHSKKINSIVDDLSGTVENLKKQYEQLFQTTFSEFHANQSKLEEDLKSLTSNVHLLVSEVVFLKRLLLFAFLIFIIFIGITRDWVNVRISLQDLHAEMNARAFALKLKSTSTNRKRVKKQEENTDYLYDDNVNDIYSE